MQSCYLFAFGWRGLIDKFGRLNWQRDVTSSTIENVFVSFHQMLKQKKKKDVNLKLNTFSSFCCLRAKKKRVSKGRTNVSNPTFNDLHRVSRTKNKRVTRRDARTSASKRFFHLNNYEKAVGPQNRPSHHRRRRRRRQRLSDESERKYIFFALL